MIVQKSKIKQYRVFVLSKESIKVDMYYFLYLHINCDQNIMAYCTI